MKKRILSILLLCCMVLTLLPTTAFAAETGAMDNIPAKFDVEIDLCGRTSDINIKDSKTYYIYSSSSDPDFVWTKKIQINGKKAAPHIFLDNVNIQVKKDAKTPAIELHGKASAYLYFINRDSKLTGATGRAAIQKNRSEGQLCVQVMKGTTVTCQGGYKAAGIGGSWATRNIAESLFNLDMYGHGANMHFGSQTNPSLWSGTIIAKGGDGGAGIGGGRNGSGEKLYFYSGKIEAKGGEAGSGIGGSFKGRGHRRRSVRPGARYHHHRRRDHGARYARRGHRRRTLVSRSEHHRDGREAEADDRILSIHLGRGGSYGLRRSCILGKGIRYRRREKIYRRSCQEPPARRLQVHQNRLIPWKAGEAEG